MDSPPQEINLDEISKIPEKEFKQYFREWLQKDELVTKHIQAKLRKDLIDNFNKTTLGRKIFSQHVKSQRLTISPLLLALNTLIAEFLYAQNCHFSLSVFCTEVPYRNTFPDFENISNFRFNKCEILEIFEAINMNIPEETKNPIYTEYFDTANQEVNNSLLFIILKNILKTNLKLPPPAVEPAAKSPIKDVPNLSYVHNSKFKKYKTKSTNSSFNNNNFRYLNKYLITLTKKIKEMSYSLDKLHEKDSHKNITPNCDKRSNTNESLKRSLEKISDNLKMLSITNGKNRKTSTIVSAVENMAKQFEKCASNFEKLSNADTDKEKPAESKTYGDWINDLQTTKSGRKFLAKIEDSLRTTLSDEKDRLSRNFEEQLLHEKESLKIKYKQKLLRQIHKMSIHSKIGANINQNFEEKLKEYELKQEEFIKKTLEESENKRKLLELERIKEQNIESEKLMKSIPKPPEITKKEIIEKISPQLEMMAKASSSQERNVDHIVFNAKLRMQGLEYESTQLDLAFQDYLNRQKIEKNITKENVSAIWENYNREKELLHKNYNLLQNNSPTKVKPQLHNDAYENILFEMPKINIGIPEVRKQQQKEIPVFENPFRNFHKKIALPKKQGAVKVLPEPDITKKLLDDKFTFRRNNASSLYSVAGGNQQKSKADILSEAIAKQRSSKNNHVNPATINGKHVRANETINPKVLKTNGNKDVDDSGFTEFILNTQKKAIRTTKRLENISIDPYIKDGIATQTLPSSKNDNITGIQKTFQNGIPFSMTQNIPPK